MMKPRICSGPASVCVSCAFEAQVLSDLKGFLKLHCIVVIRLHVSLKCSALSSLGQQSFLLTALTGQKWCCMRQLLNLATRQALCKWTSSRQGSKGKTRLHRHISGSSESFIRVPTQFWIQICHYCFYCNQVLVVQRLDTSLISPNRIYMAMLGKSNNLTPVLMIIWGPLVDIEVIMVF